MLSSYATGLFAIVALMLVWVAVQIAWGRLFEGAFADPDVLAGREGCGNCGCTDVCDSKKRGEEVER